MKLIGTGHLLGQSSYTSKETQKTYFSCQIVGHDDDILKISLEKPLSMDFKKFDEVAFAVNVIVGKFTRVDLISLDKVQQIQEDPKK